ncbi:MAG TPA: family 10 glycosylhydrolase, partial [Longimicrobiaceae bacterium]
MNRTTTRTLLAAAPLLLAAAVGGSTLRLRPAPAPALAASASFLSARPKADTAPPAAPLHEEARALWVNRWDYGDSSTIAQVMEIASRAHFNMVYFQVRGPSDARYRSQLDPCSPRLCGRLGGVPTWDPLEVAVREAHARGLQLHAWINALSGWESTKASDCGGLVPSVPGQPNHELIDHPDWAMHTRSGPQRCPNGPDVEYIYLSPGNPGVRTHLARVA